MIPRIKLEGDNLEDMVKSIYKNIERLNATQAGTCWICNEQVKNWGVLLPANGGLGLGLGGPMVNGNPGTRIAVFPICKEHDPDVPEIKAEVYKKLSILKAQETN